jgi:hypothetical protein
MGKTKDLSKDCKNTVLNLFKFFQLEKARGRPFYSPDNLIKRTCDTVLAQVFMTKKLFTGIIFEHYNFQNTLKSNKTIIMYNTRQIVKNTSCAASLTSF